MGLTQSEYDSLMRQYEERRLYNAEIIRTRRIELEETLPAYFEVDQKISAASMDYFKSQLTSDKMDKADYHKRIKAFTKEKASILEKAGYPADYLDPIYDCKDCKDTGYIDGQKCHCLKQAAIKVLYPHTQLSSHNNITFDNFSFDYYDKEDKDPKSGLSSFDYAKKAFDYCKDFVKNFKSTSGNILLYGRTGIGKTFLSTCIGKEILADGYSVLYVSAPQFMDICDKKMKDRTLSSRHDFELLSEVDLLIIDDLGTEVKSSVSVSNLLECINTRLQQDKSTIISTNYTLGDLEAAYNERFISRIVENYELLRLTGKDIRIQKNL